MMTSLYSLWWLTGMRNSILLLIRNTRLATLSINLRYEYQILAGWAPHLLLMAQFALLMSTIVDFKRGFHMLQVAVSRFIWVWRSSKENFVLLRRKLVMCIQRSARAQNSIYATALRDTVENFIIMLSSHMFSEDLFAVLFCVPAWHKVRPISCDQNERDNVVSTLTCCWFRFWLGPISKEVCHGNSCHQQH